MVNRLKIFQGVMVIEGPECKLCGRKNYDRLYPIGIELEDNGRWLVRCRNCGLVRTWSPDYVLPVEENEAYSVSPDQPVQAGWLRKQLVGWWDRALLSGIKHSSVPGSLLDAGCGDGSFLQTAQKKGWQVVGCEADLNRASYCGEVLGIEVYTDLSGLLGQKTFDVVVCRYSLEHFNDPSRELQVFRKLLAPGGRLLILVPNLASVQAKLFGRQWFQLLPADHVHHFTPATLKALVSKAGFRVLDLRTTFSPADLVGLAASVSGSLDPDRKPGVLWMFILAMISLVAFLPSLLLAIIGRGGTIKLLAQREDNQS